MWQVVSPTKINIADIILRNRNPNLSSLSSIQQNILVISALILIVTFTFYFSQTYGQEILRERPFSLSPDNAHVVDSNLKVEQVIEGLETPTTMAFLGLDDFLVLEKDKGTVVRVLNGNLLDNPILDVDVGNSVERGMVGIAVARNGSTTYVFL